MAILAPPDALQQWEELVKQEETTGHIPLPAVDTVMLEADRAPTIVLVDPNVIPGATHIFVHVEKMAPADRVALQGLLHALKEVLENRAVLHSLSAVYHLGGLDYSLCGARQDEVVRLQDLSVTDQSLIWGLLHALASLGARYPDSEASTPKMAKRARSHSSVG